MKPPAAGTQQHSSDGAPLLSVRGLEVRLPAGNGRIHVLDGIDLELAGGETLGLVGESGAGKSTLARTLLGLGTQGMIVRGSIRYLGQELIGAPQSRLRALRGRQLALIGQEAQAALHPLHRIGGQVREALPPELRGARSSARAGVLELLASAGIDDPDRIYGCHPHELSGGMRQRVMIAMALAGRPRLLIADEPTSALDVTVQAQILQLLRELCAERKMALLLISHDLDVVGALSERIAVIYAGAIIEQGPAQSVLEQAEHPYTWGLIDAMPALEQADARFMPIGGALPDARQLPSGCRFHPRCPHAFAECAQQRPELVCDGSGPGHSVACLLEPEERRRLRRCAAQAAGGRG